MAKSKGIRSGHSTDRSFVFNVSPEEKESIRYESAICGMTKQKYCVYRALKKKIVIVPVSNVMFALKEEIRQTLKAMSDIPDNAGLPQDLIDKICFIESIVDGFHN